jgi:hypothetical protein
MRYQYVQNRPFDRFWTFIVVLDNITDIEKNKFYDREKQGTIKDNTGK